MIKKWSCPGCEYESGREFNVQRHIDRKHYCGIPVLSDGFISKSKSRYGFRHRHSGPYTSAITQKRRNEMEAHTFADNYQFADKRLQICKQFLDAIKMEDGPTKNLIMLDLMRQLEPSNPAPHFNMVSFFQSTKAGEFSEIHQIPPIEQKQFTLLGPATREAIAKLVNRPLTVAEALQYFHDMRRNRLIS